MYILPPSISKKIEGYRWQSFTPPAAGKSRRFRGLICHRRSQDWLRYLLPDDRDAYLQALSSYRNKPNLAYRIEFRVKRQDGSIEWYELRATMMGQASEAGRCLGLIANVNARKEAEMHQTSPQTDGLTGLGNRLALFEPCLSG